MSTHSQEVRALAPIIYGRHLDTPLTQNGLLFYKRFPSLFTARYPGISPEHLYDLQTGKVRGVTVLHWLTEHIRIRAYHLALSATIPLIQILEITYTSIEAQIKALHTRIPDPTFRELTDIYAALHMREDLFICYQEKLAIMQVHDDLAGIDQSENFPWKIPSMTTISIFRDYIRLDEFPGGPVLITYEMFLACLDKIECHFSYLVTSTLMDAVEPYHTIGFGPFLDTIKGLLEDMYDSLGNASHYVLKSLEPIAVGNLLLQEPVGRSSHDFRDSVIDSLTDKLPACGMWAQEISHVMHQMLRDHPEHGRRAILEAYGLEKSIGFPIVDDEGGQLKMYRYGTSFRSVNTAGCEKIKGYLIQEIVWSIFARRSILIPIIPSLFYHEGITKIYSEGYIPSRDSVFGIPPEEWSQVVFRKHFEFDYRPDDMDHLLDKAIAPLRSSINQIWHPDVRNAYNLSAPARICERRFPEWILNQPSINCEEYLQSWDSLQEVPYEERVILATAKEREQKVESRSFSILTPKSRIIMTTIEHNLSTSILPLLPNHSMSLSGSQLEKRIESLVSNYRTQGIIKVSFMMDFDQWNYTFRDRAVFTFDDLFNQLFGVTHFKWPNEIFRNAKFYTGNPFTPPETDIQFTSWENHCGGNQGMRQKLWTIMTQAAIGLAMEPLPYKYQLIGSGDNQVLVAEIPENDQIELTVNRIKNSIHDVSAYLGISLKLSETYHSSRVFVYGRKYYIEGHPVSLGMKTTTRAAAGTSEGIPTINQLISTSQNAGIQLCAASSHPFIGLIAGYIESYIVLLNHRASRELRGQTNEVLASLSLFCSDLSPFNFMQLPSHLYSGHKDVLTENLAMLKVIFEQSPGLAYAMSGLLSISYGDITSECALALTLDPKSPNLDWPQSSESYIKNALREYIRNVHVINNTRVSSMMNYSSDESIHTFAQSLLEIRPLNLTVVHSLCEASMFGQVLGVVNRFIKLRTMVKMVNKSRTSEPGMPFQEIIRTKDAAMITYVGKKMQKTGSYGQGFLASLLNDRLSVYENWCMTHNHYPDCTYNIRRFLMIDSYQLSVPDIIGPYCPAPFEQIEISRLVDGEDLSTSIVVTPCRDIPGSPDLCELKRGPFAKYIGSGTSGRMQTFKLLNLSGGDFATAVNSLLALGTWFSLNGACPNLLNIIRLELESRAPGLSDVLDHVMKSSRGGCMEHRFSSPGDVVGSYSSSQSLISTHYRLSTDSATMFGRSSDDYELFFQPLLQCIYGLLRFQQPIKSRLKGKIEMNHCTRLITTSEYKMPFTLACTSNPLPIGQLIKESIRASMVRLIKMEYLSPSCTAVRIPSREVGLTATLAASTVAYIRAYQCYKAFPDSSFNKQTRPESVLNLSLVRDVELESLLYSAIVSMDYHGIFGKCSGRHAIASRLRNWARAVSGIIDVRMFKFLTDAIVQTGQLGKLCRIAQMVPRYASLNRGHVLAPVILSAMANLITKTKWKHVKWAILVRDDTRPAHTNQLQKLLKHWVASYWRILRAGNYIAPQDFLQSKDFQFREGWIITSNLLGQVEEMSRSLEGQEGSIMVTMQPDKQIRPQIHLPRFPTFKSQASCNISRKGFGDCIQQTGGADPADSMRKFVRMQRMYQMARYNGSVSGAWVKFAPIVAEFNECIAQCKTGLFLAEGGASAMRYIMHVYPDMIGIFNTLYIADETDGLEDCGFTPPGMLCPCGVLARALNIPYLDAAMGDLAMITTREHLVKYLLRAPNGPVLVTMDMQNYGDERLGALIDTVDHFLPYGVGVAIVKLFAEDLTTDLLTQAIKRWTAFFRMVLRKPVTSNPTSGEVYLVMLRHVTVAVMFDPTPALQSCKLLLDSLQDVPPFVYIQDMIKFCQINQRLPICMQSSAISTGYGAEPCKYTTPALYEAFLMVHTIRRDLTSDTDLLSRELGILFDSHTRGNRAILENYRSLLVSTLSLYLLTRAKFTEQDSRALKMTRSDFHKEFIPIISKHMQKFSLLSSVDNTWRRLGEMFSMVSPLDTTADLHFLSSIHHYQSRMPTGLLSEFKIPSHLVMLASLNQHRIKNLGSRNAPVLLFSKGLKFLNALFVSASMINRGPCKIISVEPPWMEDILTAKEWPVKFSESGNWGIRIALGQWSDIAKPPNIRCMYVVYHPQHIYETDIEVDESSAEFSLKIEGEQFRWTYVRV
nr:MAG: RNA-dependent RNA polymerase [Mononegavirales sp.]